MGEVEEWRPIPSHSGYEVSSLGRIRCWRPRPYNARPPDQARIVKQHPYRNGYLKVCLGMYGGTQSVHRLVAEQFLGPPEPGMEVAHGNGVQTDNRASNLRWATPSDNHADKRRHGTNARKLTEEIVAGIRRAHTPGETTYGEIGRLFGITPATVGKILRNELWRIPVE